MSYPDQRPLDGESIIPAITEETFTRKQPLVFSYHQQAAVIDGDYKIYQAKKDAPFMLFDLKQDPAEAQDLSNQFPKKREELIQHWKQWRRSQEKSLGGKDY